MKKILLSLLTAGLLLTACACSCGGNTMETKPTTSTKNNIEDASENAPVLADDEEDIFGDDFDDSVEDDTPVSQEETIGGDSSVQIATVIEKATQRTTTPVTDKTTISAYASYITNGTWTNLASGDTVIFNDDGTFSGKINGVKYSGTFNMRKKEKGVCSLGVTLKGTKKEVEFTVKFENSAKITLTTHKGDSEDFILQ